MSEPSAPSTAPVRRGSPFAQPSSSSDVRDGEVVAASPAVAWQAADASFDPEWGVLRAANWAAAWVALCGVACWELFPGGGLLVAAWGCGLATVGLFSSRPRAATVLLLINAGLLIACYQRLF